MGEHLYRFPILLHLSRVSDTGLNRIIIWKQMEKSEALESHLPGDTAAPSCDSALGFHSVSKLMIDLRCPGHVASSAFRCSLSVHSMHVWCAVAVAE